MRNNMRTSRCIERHRVLEHVLGEGFGVAQDSAGLREARFIKAQFPS
jgi:hypothetical protein